MKVEIPQLIDIVAEIYEITSNDIIEGKRTKVISSARKALIVAMIILGYDYRDFEIVIPRTRTMPLYYKEQGLNLFRLDKTFRGLMQIIFMKLNQDDLYKQFSSRYTYKSFDRDAKDIETNTLFTQDNTASESNKSSKLFDFTPEEEIEIRKACLASMIFMDKYGKGIKKMPIVDRKKYC